MGERCHGGGYLMWLCCHWFCYTLLSAKRLLSCRGRAPGGVVISGAVGGGRDPGHVPLHSMRDNRTDSKAAEVQIGLASNHFCQSFHVIVHIKTYMVRTYVHIFRLSFRYFCGILFMADVWQIAFVICFAHFRGFYAFLFLRWLVYKRQLNCFAVLQLLTRWIGNWFDILIIFWSWLFFN